MVNWTECLGYKTVHQLFYDDCQERYVIPAYQRHYTWTVSLIEELITDICDHINTKGKEVPYHLGCLVLADTEKNERYEIVDGQQRLITLWLIINVLAKTLPAKDKLRFSEVRSEANEFLNSIRTEPLDSKLDSDTADNSTRNLHVAYTYLKELFQTQQYFQATVKTDSIDQETFKTFLLNNTKLLVTFLPPGTDVSLYFERMNDRGEQMQATDVVKAYLFEKLAADEQSLADSIWTACSNMSRFIQSNFKTSAQNLNSQLSRNRLFSDSYTDFVQRDGKDLFSLSEAEYKKDIVDPTDKDKLTLEDFLNNICQPNSKDSHDKPVTFLPVTDFPHLLLHALNLFESKSAEPVALNENNLIDEFRHRLKDINGENWNGVQVKEFLFTLLKCRWLLDTYVIKSMQKDDESWNAWRYEKTAQGNTSYCLVFKEEDSKKIQLLMSAMHCSNSNKNYKNWLDCALRWLFEKAPTTNIKNLKENSDFADEYLGFLRTLAFLFFAKTAHPSEHSLNIRKWSSGRPLVFENFEKPDFKVSMSYPFISVYQLNYIDYLLYQKCESEFFMGLSAEHLKLLKQKREYFRFSSARTSIDHFVPQTRPETFDEAVYKDIDIDDLANLSLMSPEQNTRHLNDNPLTKMTTISIRDSISLKTLVLALSIKQLNLDPQNADWSKLAEKWNKMQQELESLIIEDYEEEKKLLENMNHSDQKSP